MAGTNGMHPITDKWGRLRNFDFCSETEPTKTWPYMAWINPASGELKVRNRTDTDWIAVGGTGGGDEKVKVSADDTTTSYLLSKLDAGTGIQLTELNPGANEQVRVTATTTLDQAYDNGRTITADAGPVEIRNTGGLLLEGDLVLDDGVGNSPQLLFVGGSNDDTFWIFLENNAAAAESDLIIKMPGGVTNNSNVIFRNANDTNKVWITPLGFVYATTFNATWDVMVGSHVDLQGSADIILDADNDTTISAPTDDQIDFEVGGADILRLVPTALKSQGSTFPNLGTTTLAEKLGNIYLGTAKDVYPADDGSGLFQRNVDHWFSPSDHFNTFTGWTWATDAPFDGAPSNISVATYPSLLHLYNDSITEDHFAYKAASGTAVMVVARLTIGAGPYLGIRIDDGDDNDFTEIRLVDSVAYPGMFRLLCRSRVGGGAVTSTYYSDPLPPAFYVLQVVWLGASDLGLFYVTKDSPIPVYLGAHAGLTWTAARYGIIFGQRIQASDPDRGGLVDWIKYTGS